MTFYSIVFGFLFVGASRSVIAGLFPWDAIFFLRSAILTVLIINDVIFTSHLIEQEGVQYSIGMKLIDLVSFLVLSMALVIIDPSTSNIYGVKVPTLLDAKWRSAAFWTALLVYWLLGQIWNATGRTYQPAGSRATAIVPALLAVPLLGMTIAVLTPASVHEEVGATVTLIAFLIYLLAFKPRLRWAESSSRRRRP